MKINLPPHYNSLAKALVSLFGTSVAITETDRLSGGDINKAYGLTLNTGNHVFMKANSKANADFLQLNQQDFLQLRQQIQSKLLIFCVPELMMVKM